MGKVGTSVEAFSGGTGKNGVKLKRDSGGDLGRPWETSGRLSPA